MVSDAMQWPLIDANSPAPLGNTGTEILGNYRFFGALEALQGNNIVWISNGIRTIVANLRNQPLFLFGRDTATHTNRPGQTPQLANWHQVTSLPEGTQIFIAGSLASVQGQLQFRTIPIVMDVLLVVLYDGTHHESGQTAYLAWTSAQ